MDGARLQILVNKGPAIAAQKIGLPYQFYRPVDGTNPIQPARLYQTAPAAFAPDPSFGKFNAYGKPAWLGYFDITATLPGDYLVGLTTYFIGSQQPLLPTQVIECNRVVTVSRPQTTSGVGALPYNGETKATATPLMTGFPASILKGSKGRKGDVRIPADSTNAETIILLPSLAAIVLRPRDLVLDDLGQRFVISSTEQSDLGWRIEAQQVQT